MDGRNIASGGNSTIQINPSQAEKRRSPRHLQAFPPPAPNILIRHIDPHKTEDERYPVQKRLGHEAERQIGVFEPKENAV